MRTAYPLHQQTMTRLQLEAEVYRVAVEVKRLALKAGWTVCRHRPANTSNTVYITLRNPKGRKRSMRVSDHISPTPCGRMLIVIVNTPGVMKLIRRWIKDETHRV